MKYARWLVPAVLLLAFAGVAWAWQASLAPRGASAEAPAVPMLPDLIRRYNVDESYVSRFARIDWSAQRQERLEAFHKEWLERLDALEYEPLGLADRIDFHL